MEQTFHCQSLRATPLIGDVLSVPVEDQREYENSLKKRRDMLNLLELAH